MAILISMGCVLLLVGTYEARPQFPYSWQIQPIIESSVLENWALAGVVQGPFEPPIPASGTSEIGFVSMSNPTSSHKRNHTSNREEDSKYGTRINSNNYAMEQPSPTVVTRSFRNRTRMSGRRAGDGPQVTRMEDGSLKLLYPNKPKYLENSVPRSTVYVPPPSATRAGPLDDVMMSDSTGEIVFPGPKSGDVFYAPPVGKEGPKCANGSTFCDTSDYYPTSHLADILRRSAENFMELFGNDVISEVNISQRIDASDETSVCASLEQVVYPKMAQNKEEQWLFVVNQDKYVQGVRVEKCITDGNTCLFTDSFPLGHTTSCKQKYIYRKMLAINDKGEPLTDTFRLPSCCACIVKSQISFGSQTSPARQKR